MGRGRSKGSGKSYTMPSGLKEGKFSRVDVPIFRFNTDTEKFDISSEKGYGTLVDGTPGIFAKGIRRVL